jgi:UDP-glucose 4-epimerase
LADLMLEVNGGGSYTVREFPSERRRIDIGDYFADFSLIRSTLGWQPRTALREGLGRTLAFYREHLDRYV